MPQSINGGLVLHDAMSYKGEWQPDAEYRKDDVVVDFPWTMVANTQTLERAAPQPTGESAPIYQGVGHSLLSEPTSNVVWCGERYTFNKGGFINAYRVYVPVADSNVEYTLYILDETSNKLTFIINSKMYAVGWTDIPVGHTVVQDGTVLTLVMAIRNPSGGSSSFNASWNYIRGNGDPLAGEIIHQNNGREMRVSWTDDGSGDQTANLATLEAGDEVSAGGFSWVITEIISNVGGVIVFDVTPQTRADNGLYNTVFTVYSPATIPYPKDLDYYSGSAVVEGLYGLDDLSNIVADDSSYGVDIEVQDAYISDDWDFVGYTNF
jgi:hypothetical protein